MDAKKPCPGMADRYYAIFRRCHLGMHNVPPQLGIHLSTILQPADLPLYSPKVTSQICWRFHRPRLNSTTLAPAIAASAITMERNTPFDRMCSGMANAYAR